MARTGHAAGRLDLLHFPDNCKAQSCHSNHQAKDRRTHLPFGPTSRRRAPPVHELHAGSTTSTSSPIAPERSTIGGRKNSRALIPIWRRRLAAASTSPPTPGNQILENLVPNLHHRTESHRSRTHPRAQRPPDAEGNGDLAGGSTGRLAFACRNCWGRNEKGREIGARV